MNAEDRAIITEIKDSVKEMSEVIDRDERINRALSVSLIGKANGETVDEGGGRIGRLERLVTWAICGVIGILVWMLAQLLQRVLVH